MPATLRRPATGAPAASTSSSFASPSSLSSAADSAAAAASNRLREQFAAVRVSFTWFGVRRTLSPDQKAQAAESFGAEGQYLTAAKKLLDTTHPAFQAVTSIRSRILGFWKGMSLPYPEPGVRLVRRQDVDRFHRTLEQLRVELADAVKVLDTHYAQLKSAARDRLGSLYNPSDYPQSLRGLFAVQWDYPSVEPPEYLLRLNPDLYQQERQRIAARFDEAVRLAEEAFVAEFSRLVSHLTERLAAGPGGERKVFRDSAVGNLREFFDRFRSLNVRSSADLDRLVETARRALSGVEPQSVRDNASLRQQVTNQLGTVRASLDQMLVEQPRRRILRNAASQGPASRPTAETAPRAVGG